MVKRAVNRVLIILIISAVVLQVVQEAVPCVCPCAKLSIKIPHELIDCLQYISLQLLSQIIVSVT